MKKHSRDVYVVLFYLSVVSTWQIQRVVTNDKCLLRLRGGQTGASRRQGDFPDSNEVAVKKRRLFQPENEADLNEEPAKEASHALNTSSSVCSSTSKKSVSLRARMFDGRTFCIECQSTASVAFLRRQLANLQGSGLSPSDAATAKLVFRGRLLRDPDLLYSHPGLLEDGSTFHVILGPAAMSNSTATGESRTSFGPSPSAMPMNPFTQIDDNMQGPRQIRGVYTIMQIVSSFMLRHAAESGIDSTYTRTTSGAGADGSAAASDPFSNAFSLIATYMPSRTEAKLWETTQGAPALERGQGGLYDPSHLRTW